MTVANDAPAGVNLHAGGAIAAGEGEAIDAGVIDRGSRSPSGPSTMLTTPARMPASWKHCTSSVGLKGVSWPA
ncbi:MAG: hypothetical protein H6643_07840 [Caldilineaceae bacterium]|nr:hypothetical protein [Caldilineaceae bacterium]